MALPRKYSKVVTYYNSFFDQCIPLNSYYLYISVMLLMRSTNILLNYLLINFDIIVSIVVDT